VNTSDLHKSVLVGKSVTYTSLKFELTRSPLPANPLPKMNYYKPRNIDFFFQRSLVVSVSKWNALLGKESTNPKENHADTNGDDNESLDDHDGIHTVYDARMTKSSGAGLHSHNDGSYVDMVLEQTLGEVQDLVVAKAPMDSTASPGDHALDWQDINKSKDVSFSLSFSDNGSDQGSFTFISPTAVLPAVGVLQNRNATMHRGGAKKALKHNDNSVVGTFLNVSRSDQESDYCPPSFPGRSGWLQMVKHKQLFLCIRKRW
jgi:hypothetical protein